MGPRRRLSSLPLDVARAELLGAARPLDAIEQVPVEQALGRVTAGRVTARSSVPHYLGAAMDGIAVRSVDTAAAGPDAPVDLVEGDPPSTSRPFRYVDTGNALPAWADAVVMIERVFAGRAEGGKADAGARGAAEERPEQVHVRATSAPWQHVRLVGEDVVESEMIVPRGHRIGPVDVGALLAAGALEVLVRPRPVVAILPTGDELVEPGEPLRPGRVVEFNSRMIAAFVREWGGEPVRLDPCRDDRTALDARLAEARDLADVVCVIAGSSAGRRDYTVDALATAGRILAQGVDVVPGRPTVLAAFHATPAARATVALGIPGYPVSAWVTCVELLEPLLAHLLGASARSRGRLRATLLRELASKAGNEELIRVSLGSVGDRRIAHPLGRGAGALSTVVRADGILRVPASVATVREGEEVEVELLRPLEEVRRNVLVAGGPDLALDVFEEVLRTEQPEIKLAASWVGIRPGSAALAYGEAHVATRVRVEVRELPPGSSAAVPVRVFHLASRSRGLLVPRGNPQGIRGVADLAGRRVCIVDAPGREAQSDPFGDGETTDGRAAVLLRAPTLAAVAAAVQSGFADAGFGNAAVARSLGLDFAPLGTESVELLLRADFAATPEGAALLLVLGSPALRHGLSRLEGYDVARTGEEQTRELLAGR